jgi:5-methylcytosine-specific restriction endonuclease McrA
VERCVVLNGDYSYLNVISWKRAVCLMVKGKTEVLKYSDKFIQNAEGDKVIQIPLVMRLIKIIRMIYKSKVPYSKRNIFVRDGFTCMYCGTKQQKLTVDHVIPQGQGGKSSFDNCVASCRSCNNKKGNRTPREAKMFLRKRPYTPTIYEFIRLKMKHYKIDEFLKELGVY